MLDPTAIVNSGGLFACTHASGLKFPELSLRLSSNPIRENILYASTVHTCKHPCVYILANKTCGTIYVGVTTDLPRRIWQHKRGMYSGFTRDYRVDRLVYYDIHGSIEEAIRREKRIKKWRRQWKIELVVAANPDWRDLYEDLL